MKFSVALAQINSVCGDVEGNIDKMCGLIERAASVGASMIVFPEMALCGYMVMNGRDFETFYKCVQRLDSPSIRELAEVALEKRIHVVFGAPMESPTQRGVVYNSAVLIEPNGKINVYNKIHLPTGRYGEGVFFEHMYCKPGNELRMCNTSLGRIGLQVCRDFAFPEISKAYSYAGADVIINISAAPVTSKRFFDMVLPVRAFENSVFFIYVNATGEQEGVKFFGHSRIIDPLGGIVAECKVGEEDFVVGDIDLEFMRNVRMRVPILKDMLPFEFYYEIMRKLEEEQLRELSQGNRKVERKFGG